VPRRGSGGRRRRYLPAVLVDLARGLPEVHFLGRLTPEQVQPAYVVVQVPSVTVETFGQVVVEAEVGDRAYPREWTEEMYAARYLGLITVLRARERVTAFTARSGGG